MTIITTAHRWSALPENHQAVIELLFPKNRSFLTLPEVCSALETLQRHCGLARIKSLPCSEPLANAPGEILELRELSALASAAVWKEVSVTSADNPFKLSSTEEHTLLEKLSSLTLTDPHFAWAHLRSRCDQLIRGGTACLANDGPPPGLSSTDWRRYLQLLQEHPGHWFRKSPTVHIGIGFHTAISIYFKLLGSACVIVKAFNAPAPASRRELIRPLLKLARYIATCHLGVLHATDGLFWDSAGARATTDLALYETPKGPSWRVTASAMRLASVNFLGEISRMPDEIRTGCPAHAVVHSQLEAGLSRSLIGEVEQWILTIMDLYL